MGLRNTKSRLRSAIGDLGAPIVLEEQ
jgi:hypothetical protein